ncbi:hypothetical protein D3C72_1245600 [compost metagenome]
MNKHCTCNTPAAIGGNRVLQRDIIGNDHDLDRNSFSPCQLGRQSEIQPVARIILDDNQSAGGAGCSLDTGKNRIGAGRSEDIACHRHGQHARTDIAGMGWLVSTASTRQDRHLPLFRFRKTRPDHNILIC